MAFDSLSFSFMTVPLGMGGGAGVIKESFPLSFAPSFLNTLVLFGSFPPILLNSFLQLFPFTSISCPFSIRVSCPNLLGKPSLLFALPPSECCDK